ncbi:MAG: family 16 glycosylhydrolase [Pseudomonadota bacterium]
MVAEVSAEPSLRPSALAGALALLLAPPSQAEVSVDVGGPGFTAMDGTEFVAETYVAGGRMGRLAGIRGVQDPALYETFREGAVSVAHPVAPGRWDVTLHFAEPETEPNDRVFDVLIEGETVLEDVNVRSFRDGQPVSGLSINLPGMAVEDGALDIAFTGVKGLPILSGYQIRKPVPRGSDWKLIWADEFDTPGRPDPERWSPNVWPAGKVNQEAQAYTPRSKNVRVEDGHLVIEAHREDVDDARYSSGRIHSAGKGDFLYGRFEIRASLPRGQGTWPAIWMLPSDPYRYASNCEAPTDWQGSDTCDAWPNSGEIDIMEHVGYQMDHVHATVHTKSYYWMEWQQRKGRIILDEVDARFHVYALEWGPDRIDAFVDDSLYFTYMREPDADWRAWPFDHAFHLVLNIAVGGAWGLAGGPIDESIFPQRMLVDWVRVYEREE